MDEVRLLGPVELWCARRAVPAGPPQQRCVLAALALSPGQTVPRATLIDRVWGERLPRDASSALYSTVSRLRRVLGPLGGTITWSGDGYRLDMDPERIDLHRARRLTARARELVRGGPDAAAEGARLLADACAIWRGSPLGGLKGDWADRVRDVLNQERLAMLTGRFEAELACGRHAEVVDQLAAAYADHPLSEPLAGLLMLALYRSGRQADALVVYARVRDRLVSELGDEPGEALHDLHTRVLRRDPALASGSVPPRGASSAAMAAPAQLPAGIGSFTGRASELGQLDRLAAGSGRAALTLVAVDGPAGVGKTALAVHWAYRARDRFPDGQLYVDLRGYAQSAPARPVEVLARFLRALGVPPERVPDDENDAVGTYRSLTADKQILVVLDNAASAEQVRPLLPGAAGCMVLVTSRDELKGLVARDGALRLSIDTLPPPDAVALLTGLLGPDRVEADRSAVDELARLCGYLPLALRIAAANVTAYPQRTVGAYVRRLRDHGGLSGLAVAGDPHTGVGAAFGLSYARRSEPARRLFRLLGLVPGSDVTDEAAASLAGTSSDHAGELLEELAAAHLLERRADGRYAFHDLIGRYARHCLDQEEPEPARTAALARLYDYYLSTAVAAAMLLNPSTVLLAGSADPGQVSPPGRFATTAEALTWLDSERHNLVAGVSRAAAHGPRSMAWRLADALRGYIGQRVLLVEGSTIARPALAAAEAEGDRPGQVVALLSLAGVAEKRSRYGEMLSLARRGCAIARAGGFVEGEAAAERLLGFACWQLGRLPEAIGHHRRALACYDRLGWRYGQAAATNSLGVVSLDLGNLRRATTFTERALAMNQAVGSLSGAAANRATLGEICRYQGDLVSARNHFTVARTLFEKVGDRYGVANSLRGLAAVHRDAGDLSTARALVRECWRVQRQVGHRRLEVDLLLVSAGIQALDDAAGAVESYRRAARLAREGANRFLEVVALIGLAAALLDLKVLDRARRHVHVALAAAGERGYRLLEAQARTVLAGIQLAEGDPGAAGTQADRALADHRRLGHRPGVARAHLVLAQVAEATADHARADKHRRAARRILARVGLPGLRPQPRPRSLR